MLGPAARPAWCVPRRGMYTLYPEVRGTGFVCVSVPKPQQQQHRTTTPSRAAVYLRVGGPESWRRRGVNPTLAVGKTFHTAAAKVLQQHH